MLGMFLTSKYATALPLKEWGDIPAIGVNLTSNRAKKAPKF
jgi:hypothetical protein